MDFSELFIAIFAIAAIFLAVPLIVFLIIAKILNNRHKERMAMIEKGINPNKESYIDIPKSGTSEEQEQEQEQVTPVQQAVRPIPKPDSKTSKWMYILAGLGVGLILSSIVENILFAFTMFNTKGFGFAIILLCISVSLYLYYNRRNKNYDNPQQKDLDSYKE